MAENSKIEWTSATWNPITGCMIKSAGCANCYAMLLAGTRMRNHPSRKGLTRLVNGKHVWTGEVRLNKEWLDQPIRWKKPRDIFAVAHGDIAYERVPDHWIDQIFAVMGLARQHRYQLLTKRPDRLANYLTERWQPAKAQTLHFSACDRLDIPAETQGETREDQVRRECEPFIDKFGLANTQKDSLWTEQGNCKALQFSFPLPNVWIGVSVERQEEADERREHLARIAAAGWNTWISYEPALGPVDWRGWEFIRWMVSGGETKEGARPSHPAWHRATRDWCARQDVPYFFKQWGDWAPVNILSDDTIDACYHPAPKLHPDGRRRCKVEICVLHDDGQRFDHSVNGAYLAGSGAMTMLQIGKKAAGAILNGREHREMPA